VLRHAVQASACESRLAGWEWKGDMTYHSGELKRKIYNSSQKGSTETGLSHQAFSVLS
jgi:hypothetical protein